MDPGNTLVSGIAPDHVPALLAVLLLWPAVWLGLRLVRVLAAHGQPPAIVVLRRYEAASSASRTAAALLLTTGVVHLALPLGHHGAPLLSLLFVASGMAFAALAAAVFTGRPWRRPAAWLLAANIVAYLVFAGSGWQEEPDQVGIATKLVELTALGLVVIPRRAPVRGGRGRLARPAASVGVVSLTLATGAVVWIGSFVAHGGPASATEPHRHAAGTAAHEHGGAHSHGSFAARAQAGVIMRPRSSEPATAEQVAAAARLASDTQAGIARYRNRQLAVADGYAPDGPMLGLEVHYKNAAYSKDNAVLDPTRPELLVYASDGRRHVLLGAAYVMPRAGVAGPEIGGPITRWHAHNVCVTLLPPAFGLVSPFGTCPVASIALTLPEMMHVWTVENPSGPYAERLDEKFVRRLLAKQEVARAGGTVPAGGRVSRGVP